jgi:hypothetical protein
MVEISRIGGVPSNSLVEVAPSNWGHSTIFEPSDHRDGASFPIGSRELEPLVDHTTRS